MSDPEKKSGAAPVPLHDHRAEQWVLSVALGAPGEVVPLVRREGGAEAFHLPAHRGLWGQIEACLDADELVDGQINWVTLCARLRAAGELEKIGGEKLIQSLLDFAPSFDGWKVNWGVIRAHWLRRRLGGIARKVEFEAANMDRAPADVVAEAESLLFELRIDRHRNEPRPAFEVADEALVHLETLIRNKGSLLGLATGIADIDRLITVGSGTMGILGAYTGVGKTMLGLEIAENISEGAGQYKEIAMFIDKGAVCPTPTLYITCEMGAKGLVIRRIAARTGKSISAMQRGFLPKGWLQGAAVPVAKQIGGSRLWYWDAFDTGIEEVRLECRRWYRDVVLKHVFPKNRPDFLPKALIVVDHIDLVKGSKQTRAQGKTAEVTEVVDELLNMAKELNQVAIIGLSQMNRENAKGGGKGKRAGLDGLSNSSAKERNADWVAILERPADYEDDPTGQAFLVRDDPDNRLNQDAPLWHPPRKIWTPAGAPEVDDGNKVQLVYLKVKKNRGGEEGVEIPLGMESAATKVWGLTPYLFSNNSQNRQFNAKESQP